jgi:hypothetical protein
MATVTGSPICEAGPVRRAAERFRAMLDPFQVETLSRSLIYNNKSINANFPCRSSRGFVPAKFDAAGPVQDVCPT